MTAHLLALQKQHPPAAGRRQIDGRPEECLAVADVLGLVGDKWSVMIIIRLGNGTMRFNEIKRAIGGISQRMLTLTLRGLEREGLLTRTQFPTIPPRVDYELTALGVSLLGVVRPLGAWARANMADMKAAREVFDTAVPS